MNRSTRLVLVGALALGSVACGGGDSESTPVEPLEITTSAIDTGTIVDLAAATPDPDTGAFSADDWPSACGLVPEATIRSMFPQAEDVVHQPSPRQINVLSIVPGSGPSQPLTVPEGDCTTTVGFTQEGLGIDDGTLVLQFTTSVPVAGDPEFVDRNTKAHMSGEPTDVGGGTCTFLPPGTYSCDLGRAIFSVTIDMRQTSQYTSADRSEFVVDGEEFSFRGADPEWESIVHDKVLQPIVKTAVTRLGGAA